MSSRESIGLQTKDPNYLLSLFCRPLLSASQENTLYISRQQPVCLQAVDMHNLPTGLVKEEKITEATELIS